MWDEDGTAAGFVTQAEVDASEWIRSVVDPLLWSPGPIPPPRSYYCAEAIPVLWPDGSVLATASCSLDPGHLEPHVALDRDGHDVLAPLVDAEAVI